MSTWISKALVAGTLLLAACDGFTPVTRSAPAALRVPGDIVVAGPVGYCIDEGATELGAGDAFVLLGSCAAITQDGTQPSPNDPAIMAVSVRSGVDVTLDDLATLFTPGATRLPGDGATVVETEKSGGTLFVHTDDGVTDTWRALLPLGGSLISAQILSPERDPLAPDAARAALDALARALEAANA